MDRNHDAFRDLGLGMRRSKSTEPRLALQSPPAQRYRILSHTRRPRNVGWRRLLRVPWTTGRLKESILKEINPEYALEGLMLKLKLQYFGHLLQRADMLEKILMLGKIESRGEGGNRG